MRISNITHKSLQNSGVDTRKYLEALGCAIAKREVTKQEVKQNGKRFASTEGYNYERGKLNDLEDFAMTVLAFDSHMLKGQKLWGLDKWEVPPVMILNAKTCWPYVKKEEESTPEQILGIEQQYRKGVITHAEMVTKIKELENPSTDPKEVESPKEGITS